ncbi:MAG TPA: type II toxin-antitoxin system RelE/ParE family toxin [Candidatus Ozemobacteraceae bacterium]|nr:type II toxin-antitoxin system RelE/ParE family toxin [Candidatus Ozemobacteraceae bacterium]
MTIRWLDLAEKDLDDLFASVARDSLAIAEKEVERIIGEVARLQSHPATGRPGRVPETRELVIPPYIVAYRVKAGTVQILRVLHSARSWPAKF